MIYWCYADVYRLESGRCCTLPFFLTFFFLSFHLYGFSFCINTNTIFQQSSLFNALCKSRNEFSCTFIDKSLPPSLWHIVWWHSGPQHQKPFSTHKWFQRGEKMKIWRYQIRTLWADRSQCPIWMLSLAVWENAVSCNKHTPFIIICRLLFCIIHHIIFNSQLTLLEIKTHFNMLLQVFNHFRFSTWNVNYLVDLQLPQTVHSYRIRVVEY